MKSEGPDKTTRMGGGGGECEPIKIHRENLAYVPNLSQRASLLARPRPHNYRKAIDPQNRVRKPNFERKYKSVQANPRAKLRQPKSVQ
jgi:hypothetical protein